MHLHLRFMGEHEEKLEAVFEAVVEMAPAERETYLARACGEDAELRGQVECLLRNLERAGKFLSGAEPRPFEAPATACEKPGDRIGRYKLLQKIGEGGCGAVYMAEQEEPIRRRVALKIIKLGMDTKQVIARFEAERQALALMDHPNIAKVLDAGATQTGRPYFVMELVRGVRITDFCDENRFSTEDRLRLFIQVCQALQHAHQKGVIHRDLKPSNILVTINDGVPVSKVIDFGIAKATQGRLTDETLFTAFEQFMGTPAYMSPEQAVMTSLDIDTRSDIYSLGVLLYELLTGRTPFDPRELLAAGLDAMRRTIREQEPLRPSTRLSTLAGEALTTTASLRQTEAPKLIHLVRGDLDWIVMKCLEKDRARRYETANGLAMDLKRHLNNEPVVACPPSNLYRLRKAVRRNRLLFAGSGLVLLVLLGGIAGTTGGWLEALRQKQEAQRQALISKNTTEFLQRMFDSIDPVNAKLREITVREILDEAGRTIDMAFTNQPLVELPIRLSMHKVYGKLGRPELALAHAERALKLARTASENQEGPELAAALDAVGSCLTELGRSAEALPNFEDALKRRQLLYNGDHIEVAESLNHLAICINALGRAGEALPRFEAALRMRQRLHSGDHQEVAGCLNDLASCLFGLGRFEEALANYTSSAEMRRRIFKGDHPEIADSLSNIGVCLGSLGRAQEGLTSLEAALQMRQRIYPGDHPAVAGALNDTAYCMNSLGRTVDALARFEAASAMWQRIYEGDHPDVAMSLNNVAMGLIALGRSSEALAKDEVALQMWQRLYPGDHPSVANGLNEVCGCLRALDRPADALEKCQAALQMWQRIYKADHPDVAKGLNNVAYLLSALGRTGEALPILEQALEMYQRLFPGDHPYVAAALNNVAGFLASLDRSEEALKKYEAALEMKRRIYESDHPDLVTSLKNLGARLEVVGRIPEAIAKWREAAAMLERLTRAEAANLALQMDFARCNRRLGDLLADSGDTKAASISYQQGLQAVESIGAKDNSNSNTASLRLSFRADLGLEVVEVVVLDVLPGGQAETVGLQKGDILTRYSETRVTSESQIRRLIKAAKGEEIELQARRAAKPFQVKVRQGKLGVTFTERSIPNPSSQRQESH